MARDLTDIRDLPDNRLHDIDTARRSIRRCGWSSPPNPHQATGHRTSFPDSGKPSSARLAVPVFYSAGEFESGFAENAKQLYDATPKGVARTLLLGAASSNHGLWLTDPTVGVLDLRAKIAAFLQQYAPAA